MDVARFPKMGHNCALRKDFVSNTCDEECKEWKEQVQYVMCGRWAPVE